MKKLLVLLPLLLMLITMSTGLFATSLLVDDFTGLTVGNNLAGQSSWIKGGTGPDPTIGNSTTLTYSGYNGGGSEYVALPTASATSSRVYKSLSTTPAPGTNTFYYSALIRLTGTTATGDYFLSLSDASTGYFARLFAKTSGAGFVLGISKNANVATAAFGSTVFNLNQTYLVVFRYSFIAGTTNDEIYLWVNPTLTSEPSTASAEAANSSAADVTPSTVAVFAWHNRTANNPAGAFDAVRVAYGATSTDAWNDLNASASTLAAEPTAPPTGIGFNTTTTTSFNVTYAAASPVADGYIAIRKAGSAPTTNPADGTGYTLGNTLGDGIVAYSGANLTFPESGLTPGTTYYYKIYSYNGSGATANYLVTSFLSGSQATSPGVSLPTVTTTAVTSVTTTTASSGGNVTAEGGAPVSAKGVCWATTAGPLATGSHTSDGTGPGAYVSSLSALSAGTTYYLRAYATSTAGTSYGNEISFITVSPAPVATSATGNTSSSFMANWGSTSGAASYQLDVSLNNGFSSFVSGYNNLFVSGTSQTVSGLSAATTYYYRVRAVNASGTSINSNFITTATNASDPYNGYYSSVSGLTGASLKAGLHTIIKANTVQFSYDAVTTQLAYTDQDSTNSSNVIEIYTGWSVPAANYGGGTTDWNKEHTWSKSHGGFGDVAPCGTDLHHLRPCDATVNSAKNNADFDEATEAYTDASPPSGYTGDTGCYKISNDVWEPRPEDKGDVARMIFYMAVRYEADDPYNLEVVDYLPSSPSGEPYYAKLSTLLSWAAADPPSSWERRRNNRIYERQGNRNPFIDHPEYITSIWGGTPEPPTVTTAAITSITLNSAAGGGEVTSVGSTSVTARGICWSSTGTPSIINIHTTDGSGLGTFTSSMTSLAAGTLYYVRAYATNSVGTSYGNEVTFSTWKNEPAAHVTNFAAGTATSGSIPLTWTDATADGYLLKGSAVSYAAITAPVDGTPEADGGLVLNVASGLQTCTFTGLSSGTTYYFKIYPYNNSGAGINYRTAATVPQASATTLTVITLSVLPTTMTFNAAYNTYSAAQSATITSSGLSLPINLSSNGTYEFCATENGAYSATLQFAANYNGLVWVKFHPVTVGSFSNTISLASGANLATIAANGTAYDPNATFATDLFISEYVEALSNQKAIEIFNGTGSSVDLAAYSLMKQTNGAGAFGNELVLSGTLANNDVFVIVYSSTTGTTLVGQPYVDLATTSMAMGFNGNDAVALYHSGVQTDVVGVVNQVANWGTDSTFVRNSNITSPTTDFNRVRDWTAYPVNTFIYLGSHTFIPGTGQAAAPQISPAGGLKTSAVTVTMSTTTPGGQIRYTLDGTDPTVTSALYGSSFLVSSTTVVKAVTYASGYSASGITNVTYSFASNIPNIAALRALTADTGIYYKLTGEAVLTLKSANYNVKYIQDGTGAIMIYDAAAAITTAYNLGDGITGITGTLHLYNGMLEFYPALDPGAATSTGHVITPETVTLANLTTSYQARLVKLEGITVTGTGSWTAATNYDITDAVLGTGILRTQYSDLDYIGFAIPATAKTIVGVVLQYNAVSQFIPRSLEEFTDAAPPAAPTGLVISASGNDIRLDWNNDPTVTSWTVWSAENRLGTFTLRGTYTTNSCVLSGEALTYPSHVYYVIANR